MIKFGWATLIFLNLIRFFGFGISPPGFYIDEAVGAAHALCVKQTGADYWNVFLPLFSAGPGGGFFTSPYVYGQVLWTSIWGDSIAAFRTFSALVTCLTIVFLVQYVRRKANERTALWVALLATISPWVFQFSRIAWDPPLAPMLIVLGLLLLEGRSKFAWLWSTIAFSVAAYAYPPTRAQVPLLLVLLPGMNWKTTAKMISVFLVFVSPVLWKSTDPYFTARTRMLALTSDYSGNPYKDASFFGLVWAAIEQTFAHFSWKYLMVSGDTNLRHSTQRFGIFSWTQFAALAGGLSVALIRPKAFWNLLNTGSRVLIWIGVVGSLLGIAPAALTWEGVPHSIRSIGAWPFLCILGGVMIELAVVAVEKRAVIWAQVFKGALWVTSLVFFALYLNVFFGEYPIISQAWYQLDREPISQAYSRMAAGERCEDIRGR